ncbi:MAG: tRNA (adenosine(37)-N6)-threonylcarbamoyltransferase complex ATPase subunit type 1 TsaE [bacterium]
MEEIRKIVTQSAEETVKLGWTLGERAGRGLFIGLSGDLGGGKTTLTQGIARGLSVEGAVTSPTFQLLREYSGRERLYHFDFYRLESGADLFDLDIAGCLKDGVVVAEWSERFEVPDAEHYIMMRLDWESESCRRIEFTGAAGDGAGLLEALLKEFESQLRKE